MQSFSTDVLSHTGNHTHPHKTTYSNVWQHYVTMISGYCHMTKDVVSYDTERRFNDGGRPSSIAQRTRVDALQAHQEQTRVFLCAEMEARSNLHRVGKQVINNHEGRCLKEDCSSINQLSQKYADPPIIFLWRDDRGGP